MTKLNEAQKELVARFFYFALFDASIAYHATKLSLQKVGRELHNIEGEIPSSVTNAAIVKCTNQVFDIVQKSFSRPKWYSRLWHRLTPRHHSPVELLWQVPEKIDVGMWREYQKVATRDEMLALIWSKLLHISDAEIAEGLQISLGTARFRVGKSLRALGQMQLLDGGGAAHA